jgi:muramoyltetrapeptide carboxypeptidase
MTIIPPFLKQGSTIGITCPSSHIPIERISFAAEILHLWGFNVKFGETAGGAYHYFSGTDEARQHDLQAMLDNPEIDAILMGRGGYGMSRIIDKLDFTQFLSKPKWICGFSDIVVLLNHLQAKFDVAGLHSPMCNAFKAEQVNSDHLKSLYAALTGESLHYNTNASPHNRTGSTEGVLTGGNLAILAHLLGSKSEVDTNGKILFIEDVGEHLYNVDRMMLSLKRAGKLDNLKALIVGGLTDMEDTERPFGQTVEEIIADKVKEYAYPVCFNFPCGHQEINYTLCMGTPHRLVVTTEGGYFHCMK